MLLPRACFVLAGTIFHLLPGMSCGRAVEEPQETRRLRLRRGADEVTGDEGRIVNGVEATPHEFPSFLMADWQDQCHLSLIRRRWGLTAAHCIAMEGPVNITNPKDWEVMAGKHNHSKVEDGQETGYVSKAFLHEGYDKLKHINDIALVKFERPFNLSATIQPATLPPRDYKGLDCLWVVGIKKHCIENITELNCSHPYEHPNVLKVDVPIMSDEQCNDYLLPAGAKFNTSMSFCAGYEKGGKDKCGGDSGCPAYFVKDGKQIQVGIVASGMGCALPKLPGIYTRVAAYVDWIEETIRKEEELDPTPEP